MKNSLLVFLFLVTAIRGYGQCTLSVNLSSSGPAICSGSSVVLTATASAGTAPYSYAWSTGEVGNTINPNKPGTYTVTVSDKTPGCQPVKQSITITSAAVPPAPTVANAVVCPNTPATLTASAPGGTYQWYDAATGGNFLASGATYVTQPIVASTTFYVQTTINGCASSRSAVNVKLIGNPGREGATVCFGSTATLLGANADTFVWYDAASGGNIVGNGAVFVTPVLFATTTYYLEGITNGCVSQRIPVVAIVTPPPQPPVVANITICSGSAGSLHATSSSGGTIDWFTAPTGGTSLITSPDYTTPPLSATTTYYVQASVNTCTSSRTPVTVTVNPVPSAPVVPAVAVCTGSSATLTPTGPGGTYNWYNAPTGGTLLATGPSFTTPALNNSATYYVDVTNGGCSSSTRTAVNVTVTPPPSSPSASGAIICPGTTAVLTATAPGGVYQWYDAATAGNLLATNTSYTTPVLNANTTYYVQTTVAGCTSGRTPITVTVLAPPAAPAAPGVNICSGNSATLSVTSPIGNYAWYDAPAGGNLLITGSSVYVTPALSVSTTYYVEAISASGCTSIRTPVTVTVTAPPGPPVVSGTIICSGTSTTLTATAAGAVSWYDAASGGNLLATGNSFTTPLLYSNTTYYVVQASGPCFSSPVPVTVSITSVANPQFQYSAGTFCTTATNPTPVINNPSGGTFSAAPAGLVFVSTTTGQINVAASLPGKYVISFAGNGACPTTTNEIINIINTPPDAHFSYGSLCQDLATALPAFPAGASSGIFSASSPNLVFANPSTGEINLLKSKAGVYNITNTIAAGGTCGSSTFTLAIVVDASVDVVAGPNQVIPFGTTALLAGSITGGATTGTWSGGTGSFSNPTALNAVYTPGPGETSAALTLTSAKPAGSCNAKSDKLTITITPAPAAPTAAGVSVCSGSSATLSATAPGGSYAWYDAPAGGSLLSSGNIFITPSLTVNTTYYVQTTVGEATSPRTAVVVTVNAIPAAPVAAGTAVCSGNTATLAASGSTGSYQWYDSPSGGNLLSTNSIYTTTLLIANTSYYVQAVNSCVSTRTQVDVTVNPVPGITSSPVDNICSGTALNYTITSGTAGATFTWSRAAVAGISNPAITNQTTSTITETLINTGATPVNVTYVITPMANGCTGIPFNYVVTVNSAPTVSSLPTVTVCNGTPVNYNITFNNPAGVTFTWSRATVAGISNAAISGQSGATIRESLFNTTNAPIDVAYVINYQTSSCAGLVFNLTVTVDPGVSITSAAAGAACSGVPQGYTITSNVTGATYSWSRAAVAGVSNPAVSAQTSATINEALNNTGTTPVMVLYMITPSTNGCAGTVFQYTVTVNPAVPTPVANANSPICAGSDINLQSPIISNATYNWSGPNGFTSAQQNPTITNAGVINSGTYNLFITINGCAGATASVTVTVDPPPVANAGPPQTVCTNVASVPLAGSVTGGTTTGSWSTAGSGTFSPAPNVLNALYLPSAADIAAGAVVLTLASTSTDNCSVSSSNVTLTFKSPSVTSAPNGSICNATAQNYVITSDFPAATFTWSRAAVAGITNPAVAGQTSGTITEILNNPGNTAIDVVYIITANIAGCPGKPFMYTVTVNPTPVAPIITVNSPVCVNSTIQLSTPALAGATYSWTGPNGFTSVAQNPTVPNVTAAAAGTYTLTVSANGCTGPSSSVNVVVDALPVSYAGKDQVVCPITPSVQLAGTETGGTPTGKWSTSGTGTFSSPTALNAQYFPSAADVAAGSVTLTLASTSADDCAISTSTMTIKFQLLPALTAGPDQSICSQSAATLAGQITIPGGAVWSTSGSGTFAPSAAQLNATYLPSAADVKNGFVVLTLTANSPGQCYIPMDVLTLKFIPPPTVSAGKPILILKGHTATLSPTVSDPNVTYSWSPNIDISNPNIENPVVTGNVDRTYTLTVTDVRGCQSSASVEVTVSPEIIIPNTFTPNGDGINDQWNIQGLVAYQQATVDVFDRNGQRIFHSVGYGTPWDGTYKGQQVPYGVYYYIIDPKALGLKALSGSITVIR